MRDSEVRHVMFVARDWNGTGVRELLGPRDLNHAEATRIIGEQRGEKRRQQHGHAFRGLLPPNSQPPFGRSENIERT